MNASRDNINVTIIWDTVHCAEFFKHTQLDGESQHFNNAPYPIFKFTDHRLSNMFLIISILMLELFATSQYPTLGQ